MNLESSLNQVLQVLRNSGLHYSAQETPYSLYISIRKKIRQNTETSSHVVPIQSSNPDEKNYDLTKECKVLENAFESAKHELDQEIDEHRRTMKENGELVKKLASNEKLIENLKQESEVLKEEISGLDCDVKALKKNVKFKEKELYDLNKESKTSMEKLETAKSDLKILSAQVKKFEKDELKKSKVKQVKDTQNNLEFPCEFCHKKFEFQVKLQVHVKLDHYVANSSQTNEILVEAKSAQTSEKNRIDKIVQTQTTAPDDTEVTADFESYCCFYCNREISCEQNIDKHRGKCHGVSEFPSLFSLPVRCAPR